MKHAPYQLVSTSRYCNNPDDVTDDPWYYTAQEAIQAAREHKAGCPNHTFEVVLVRRSVITTI